MGTEEQTSQNNQSLKLFNRFRRRKSGLKRNEAILGYWLIAPSVFLIAAVIIYPILYNIWISFHEVNLNPNKPNVFVGLKNYTDILTDGNFWNAIKISVIFTASTVIGATIVGLCVALILNRSFKGRGLVRGIVLLPYVAPVVSVVFVWQYIFNPVFGIANYFLVDILGILPEYIDWVDSSKYALGMVIFFEIWRLFPFAFLMILAKLQSVPTSLYEAAEVDGAKAWTKFRWITLPELKYVIGAIIILRSIWNFNKFDDIYLLTKSVNVVPVYAFEIAFNSNQHGLAAAITAILFVFIMTFVVFYVKKVLKW